MAEKNFSIDSTFRDLLMPLADDDFEQLRQDIIEHGCLTPLVVTTIDDQNVLLDGHHRLRVCEAHGIDYAVRHIELPDRNAAHNWVITHQLTRRNVTAEQAAYLRGKLYIATKADPQANLKQNTPKGHNVPSENTAEKVGAQCGVTGRTVKRDAEYTAALDKLDEATRQDVLAGKVDAPRYMVIDAAKSDDPSGALLRNAAARDVAKKKRRAVTQLMRQNTKPQKRTAQIEGKGVILAHEALNHLMRIPCNDKLRDRAFEIIMDYCEANSGSCTSERALLEQELISLTDEIYKLVRSPSWQVSLIELKSLTGKLRDKVSHRFPK